MRVADTKNVVIDPQLPVNENAITSLVIGRKIDFDTNSPSITSNIHINYECGLKETLNGSSFTVSTESVNKSQLKSIHSEKRIYCSTVSGSVISFNLIQRSKSRTNCAKNESNSGFEVKHNRCRNDTASDQAGTTDCDNCETNVTVNETTEIVLVRELSISVCKKKIKELHIFDNLDNPHFVSQAVDDSIAGKQSFTNFENDMDSGKKTTPIVNRESPVLICLDTGGTVYTVNCNMKISCIARNAGVICLKKYCKDQYFEGVRNLQIINPFETATEDWEKAVLCIAQKHSLLLYSWHGNDFEFCKEIALTNTVSDMLWVNSSICLANRQQVVLLNLSDGTFQNIAALTDSGSSYHINMILLRQATEVLIISQNNIGIFYDLNFQPAARSSLLLPPKDLLRCVAVESLLVCGYCDGDMEVGFLAHILFEVGQIVAMFEPRIC